MRNKNRASVCQFILARPHVTTVLALTASCAVVYPNVWTAVLTVVWILVFVVPGWMLDKRRFRCEWTFESIDGERVLVHDAPRSKLLRAALVLTGVVMLVMASAPFSAVVDSLEWSIPTPQDLFFVWFFWAPTAVFCIFQASRATTKSARTTIESQEPFSLYLRAFHRDERDRVFLQRFEERVAASCGKNRLVAIADKADAVPFPGAARLYVDEDDKWEIVVTDLLRRAAFVIVRIDNTPGVRKEFNLIVECDVPDKVALLVVLDEEQYRGVRPELEACLPRGLPHSAAFSIVYFTSDWEPRIVSSESELEEATVQLAQHPRQEQLIQLASGNLFATATPIHIPSPLEYVDMP